MAIIILYHLLVEIRNNKNWQNIKRRAKYILVICKYFLYKNGKSKKIYYSSVSGILFPFMTKKWVKKEINHINEDKLDNRVENFGIHYS